MTAWSEGYVVDIEYTTGFYHELTPTLLSFSALVQGYDAPGLDLEARNYCELGCGQGFSTNLMAAANPHIQFYANDFNPAHIAGAQALARSAELTNVHFSDNSFVEYLERADLPAFDYITLHGIYSWVSAENRQAIRTFIRKKLKPGGVVYVSYNCMPGWASTMPLRRILIEHAELSGLSRPLTTRISDSLTFAQRLADVGARYFVNHPKASNRLGKIKNGNPKYIAHEYFNKDLTPFYFSDIAEELSEAKLTWVGAIHTLDALDNIQLTQEQRNFLAEIENPILRQTIRDHIIDQQFRRDVFVKGPVSLTQAQVKEKWLNTYFILNKKANAVPRSINGAAYQAKMKEEVCQPVISALERSPHSVRELLAMPELHKAEMGEIIEIIMSLVAQGSCHPCLPKEDIEERSRRVSHFNKVIAEHAASEKRFSYLASPVTGGGIVTDLMKQLFWLSLSRNASNPAQAAHEILSKAGQKLTIDGKETSSPENMLAEFHKLFSDYSDNVAPIWKAMGIIR